MAKVAKIYDGTAWVDLATSVPDLSNYQLKSEGGLTFVKKQTIGTAVSSVTVSDAFSATYDAYKIIAANVTTTGTTNLRFDLTGITTGYYGNIIYANFTGGGATVAAINNLANNPNAGGNSNGISILNMDVVNPFLARPTIMTSQFLDNTNAGTTTCIQNSSTSATAFTITPGSGTLTGGAIYVYGYNKG